ncbi:unnamed protein product [Urochloa decumbens]|uniref:F-box domain-containing protein n=1 Tax=Urochloa decumbens TaxID=240449 RepID=A0ABC9F0Y7_9POAL
MAAPPPELIEDAVAEILLRLPGEDPACLVRASLVCRLWRRILSDPAFLRRYRRFHRTPPLLGFFADAYGSDPAPRFVPTAAAASPFSTAAFHSHHRNWLPLDFRHGRFLLRQVLTHDLLVWDPITGDREELYHPGIPYLSAAVLCAAPGCDHCDCHGTSSPFLVVCAGIDDTDYEMVDACVYSSQVGEWFSSASVLMYRSDPFVNAEGAAGWILCRELELETVLPVDNPINRASVIGFAEGVNVILVGTEFGTFTVDLKSGLARKLSEQEILYHPVIPFTSFYTPGCACSKLPLPVETN